MRRLFYFISALFVLSACTQTKEVYVQVPYDTDMLIGTWLYTHGNGKVLPTSERDMDIFYNDSVIVYVSVEDGKWTETEETYTLTDGVFHYSDGVINDLVYLDEKSMTIKDRDGNLWTACKLTDDMSDDIIGTWEHPINSLEKDAYLTMNEDGTFSVTGKRSYSGRYHLYQNCLILCASGANAIACTLERNKDEYGPLMDFCQVDSTGTDRQFTIAKQLGNYTLDMLDGSWLNNVFNGIVLSPQYLTIEEIGQKNGKWVETFYMQDTLADNSGQAWIGYDADLYLLRGRYLMSKYDDSFQAYKILQLTNEACLMEIVFAQGLSLVTKGDVLSSFKVQDFPDADQIIGTWQGTIFADGHDNLTPTITITKTNGVLTYVSQETETRTVYGNVYLYGPNFAVFEQTSPAKSCDRFFLSFANNGNTKNWTHWNITFADELGVTYDAHAEFTKQVK